MYAIEHDHLAMVNYLIENGADVDYNPPNKPCPLMYALEKGNNSIVRCLIEYEADINIFKSGYSLLMRSIQMKKISLCKYLIGLGSDVNVYNSCCVTALTLAIESGNMEMVKYLVCHDADIHGEAIDIIGDPEDYEVMHENQPLIHAIKNKNVTMVNYLLKEMDFYDFEDIEIDPEKKKNTEYSEYESQSPYRTNYLYNYSEKTMDNYYKINEFLDQMKSIIDSTLAKIKEEDERAKKEAEEAELKEQKIYEES